MSSRKNAICNHPFRVISELLRTKQREKQVRQHQRGHHQHDDRFHVDLLYLIRSQK
jgi:hypothetical protein